MEIIAKIKRDAVYFWIKEGDLDAVLHCANEFVLSLKEETQKVRNKYGIEKFEDTWEREVKEWKIARGYNKEDDINGR